MKPNVLIVDDDQMVREAVAQFATWAGFRVLQAAHAAEGMRVLSGGSVDVVVTDVKMPGKSGINFLSEARFAGHEVPFIVLTGFGTKENAIEALRLGAYDFIEKPFEGDELQSLLRQAAGLAEAETDTGFAAIVARLSALQVDLKTATDTVARQKVLWGLCEEFGKQAPKAPSAAEEPRYRAAALGARAAKLLLSFPRTSPKDMAKIVGAIASLYQRACEQNITEDPAIQDEIGRFGNVLTELERRMRVAG